MGSKRVWLAIVFVLAGLGLFFSWPSGPPEGLTIRQAETLTLYEGLPHQNDERELFASEKKTKSTIELHGFPFYSETLTLKPGDVDNLKATLGDSQSYRPPLLDKKCGGFHPDFAVGWTVADTQYICLVCFGCYELRLYGARAEQEYDMTSASAYQLKSVLTSYRQNRPPHE